MVEARASKLQIVRIAGTLAVALLMSSADAAPKKQLKLGEPAPKFRLRTLNGTMVRLDELAYKGREKRHAKKRPVLLDFFRTDCAPCRKSMPELVKIHNAYHAQGLKVLLVALLENQDGRGKLERYLTAQGLPFTVVVDHSEYFAERYLGNPVTLPATFLIDRTGKLKKVKYGGGDLKAAFEEPIKLAMKEHQKAL